MHEHAERHDPADPGLLNRIRGIAALNAIIGAAEFTAGIVTNSSTLTMAGVHDATDGGLYELKFRAASECDHTRKQKLRRIGAGALIGATLTIGSYEIAKSTIDDHRPEPIAAWVGVVAAGANLAAAGVMHSKRSLHDSHDTWRHIVGVDMPASLVTLVVTPLSVKYPGLDVIGASAHMLMATTVGVQTLRQISADEAH